MTYKIGDEVRVKPYEELRECFIVAEEMLPYAGQIVTICEVMSSTGCYYIVEDDGVYYWDDECFVGLADECDEWGRTSPDLSVKQWSENIEEQPKSLYPKSLVDILKDKVSELETRVAELERKLEQVIKDA